MTHSVMARGVLVVGLFVLASGQGIYAAGRVVEYDFSDHTLWEYDETARNIYEYQPTGERFRLAADWGQVSVGGPGDEYFVVQSDYIAFPEYSEPIIKIEFVLPAGVTPESGIEVRAGEYDYTTRIFSSLSENSYPYPTVENASFVMTASSVPELKRYTKAFAVSFSGGINGANFNSIRVYFGDAGSDTPVTGETHITISHPSGDYPSGTTVTVSTDNSDAKLYINGIECASHTLSFSDDNDTQTLNFEARDTAGKQLCSESRTYGWKSVPAPTISPVMTDNMTPGSSVTIKTADGTPLAVTYTLSRGGTETRTFAGGSSALTLCVPVPGETVNIAAESTLVGCRPGRVTAQTTVNAEYAGNFSLSVSPSLNDAVISGTKVTVSPSTPRDCRILYAVTSPGTEAGLFDYQEYDESKGIVIYDDCHLSLYAVADDTYVYSTERDVEVGGSGPIEPVTGYGMQYRPLTDYSTIAAPEYVTFTDEYGTPSGHRFANYYIIMYGGSDGDYVMSGDRFGSGMKAVRVGHDKDGYPAVTAGCGVLEFALIESNTPGRYVMFIPGEKIEWPLGTDESVARAEWLASGTYFAASDSWSHTTMYGAPPRELCGTTDVNEALSIELINRNEGIVTSRSYSNTHRLIYDTLSGGKTAKFMCSCQMRNDMSPTLACLAGSLVTDGNGLSTGGVEPVREDDVVDTANERWYTVEGIAIEGRPSRPGLYINASTRKVILVR